MVRAKFQCSSVTIEKGDQSWHYKENNSEPLDVVTVRRQAAVANSGENKEICASTPSGSIELRILRPEAVDWYYVDFNPADK
jgi:hypothetical protein